MRLLVFLFPFVAVAYISYSKQFDMVAAVDYEMQTNASSIVQDQIQLIEAPLLTPDSGKTESDTWIRTGKHKLTLQWISWDKPGSVMITTGNNGWFNIKGDQKSSDGNDYLSIEGKVKPLSDKELVFEGEITYSIATINSGEPCVKTGQQTFLSTKGRKYWRLQNMLHCVEGTTDYIDIYF